ncbi:Fe-S cluster assembly ATPase SufC [archaeon]|nr:Fe-S cluster assembly ATPase SufC [archaeon]|tara:strand:- start:6218 stop:6952 length:735 start_codon:yes stop_codon:yes gene_type:complete
MNKLEIKDLYVEVEGKEILKGVNLVVNGDETVVLMGQNGAGKSTIGMVLMGHPLYKITKGSIIYNDEDISELKTEERAKKGLFLSFQHPFEIPGLSVSNFLRSAYNSINDVKVNVMDFYNMLKEKMVLLKISEDFVKRPLNEGFSGGEKKKTEILQLSILNPKIAILDETDSGTDIDSMKVIADGLNKIKEESKMGMLLITHYNRFLSYLKPDRVYVLKDGKIVKEGDDNLVHEIEEKGYEIFA